MINYTYQKISYFDVLKQPFLYKLYIFLHVALYTMFLPLEHDTHKYTYICEIKLC